MTGPRSRMLFAEAGRCLPGGVDSPVRAFRAVGGEPLFISHGDGAWITDVDDRRYVDHVLSWGALILGHAPAEVIEAIQNVAARGTSFGAPTALETELALAIRCAMPSLELIRFVVSGTEATMSALRVARAHTGRARFVKCIGCYHGHADPFLVQAGSGVATLGLPDSPGVAPGAVADTLVAPFNDLDAIEDHFRREGDRIAAVILEPVAGNMGVVAPLPGFLEGLRALTHRYGALLIFDEVMTGFRVHPGGAQALTGVTPDLTTLGKVIGGGLPVGAYGGREELMRLVAPSGPVYQAGTLAGNPVSMAAGLATLRHLAQPGTWERASAAAERLAVGVRNLAADAGIPVQVPRVGAMLSVFFAERPIQDWEGAQAADRDRFARVFHQLLRGGVAWVPSPYEAAFLSTAHGAAERELTLRAFGMALDRERSLAA